MRKVVLFLMFGFSTVTYGLEPGVLTRSAQKSFLSAQKFPTVYQDLSFVDRMANEAAGYEPWESEYDDNGRCIKNCAYDGITIEEDIALSKRQTELALKELEANGYIGGATQPTAFPGQPAQLQQNKPMVAPNGENVVNISVMSGDKSGVPFGSPLYEIPKITSKFGLRMHPIKKKMLPHQGVDISARTGTELIAPANGTVTNVWNEGRTGCGKGLKIQHDMGFETVYCHLSDWKVSKGQTVVSGQLIALSGNTGGSTGPHLHYGIKHNGVFVNPEEFIGR